MSSLRRTFAAAAALLALQPTVAADEYEDEIEEVLVTALKRPVAAEQLAFSVDITRTTMSPTLNLVTDALADATGVAVQQTTPGQGAAIIRGQRGSAILHLVDGMRLNNAIFRSAPTQYLALVPGVAIESAEVLRGTPASLYGSDAIGGVVQLVTRKPEFNSDAREVRGSVSASFGSAESLRRIAANIDAGSHDLFTTVSVDLMKTGDRRTGGDREVGPSDFSSHALRWMTGWTPDDRRHVSLDIQFLEQPETPRVDELVPGFGQAQPSSSEFLFSPNRRTFVHGNYSLDSAYLGADWKFDVAWQRIDDDRVTRDFQSTTRVAETNRSDLFGLTFSAGKSTEQGSWVFGGEYYFDSVDSARTNEDIVTGNTTVVASRYPDGSDVRSIGVYGNASWQLSSRHALSTGVRVSRVETTVAATSVTTAAQQTNSDLSGDLGWVMKVSDDWQVAANIGFGFRAPNIFDIGALGPRPGNRFNIPNASLTSERVVQGEIALRRRSDDSMFEFVLWSMRYTDRITSVSTGAVTPDGRDVVQSVNAASAELRGFETAFRFSPDDRWHVAGSLGYTWGIQRVGAAASEPADRIPPLFGRLRFEYDASARWRFHARLNFADRQPRLSARDVRDNRINPAGTPGWSAIDVGADWEAAPDWFLTIALENVSDVKYRSHGSGIDAPGRNLLLSIRRSW